MSGGIRDGRSRVTVIGVGNPFRGDDAVGLLVAERLQARRPGLRVVAHTGDILELCEVWKEAELAVVVDAVSCREAAGTIQRYDVRDAPVPRAAFRRSTHAFGVGDAVELSRAVGALPPRLVVYGVVGSCFEVGDGVSPAVGRAVDELTDRLLAEFDAGIAIVAGDDQRA